MSLGFIAIELLPYNIKFLAKKGENLLEILRKSGVNLSSSCGGHGVCGKCLVKLYDSNTSEWKLVNACQVSVNENVIVDLSPATIFSLSINNIGTLKKAYNVDGTYNLEPNFRKKIVNLCKNIDFDYLSQIYNCTESEKTSYRFLNKLSHSVLKDQLSGWVVYNSEKLIDWYSLDTTTTLVGCAIDIGTTNIAIEILNLETGETLYQGFDTNSQTRFGDDVISRISYSSISEKNLEELKNSVLSTVNGLIIKGLNTLSISPESIYEIVLAGNTTMIHLILGISPKSLGEFPFLPIFTSPITLKTSDLGIIANSDADIYILPAIGSFVGGDISGGLLALNLFECAENFLFLDLGTNGEIVLGCKGKFIATSTATGPAFEGGRISCGMRADDGAIDHIFLSNEDISFSVIGDSIPKGICGSGVIELVCLLLELKLLDPTGKFMVSSVSQSIPQKILERFKIKNEEAIFIVYEGGVNDREIFLSAKDIRQVQLACGAIKCGVKMLLSYAGISSADLDTVYIAGNFGNYIHPKYLSRLGIVPSTIFHEKIHIVGNTSLLGAKIALLDMKKRKLVEKSVGSIKHIDLATLPNFEEEFAFSMFFPDAQ
ncbi:MAG: ASKHA domain-containing protein [Candidatus Hydrogenedentes bacterium]|nr:ASKHA domain-containing protein [Candidatus Hydrogenedentota bacterium]